jgi:hypothetical protein
MDQDNPQNFLNIKYWTIWHWWFTLTFIYIAYYFVLMFGLVVLGLESIISTNIAAQALYIILERVIHFIGLFVPITPLSFLGLLMPTGIGGLTISLLLFFFIYFFSKRIGLDGWKLAVVNLLALFIATFIFDLNWASECFWPSMHLFLTNSQCVHVL